MVWYGMEAFFTRHTRLFSSFALPGRSHAVLSVFFDYGIPPHGVARCGFRVVHRVEKRDAENTAKPRRNCSGEALPLTHKMPQTGVEHMGNSGCKMLGKESKDFGVLFFFY